MSPGSAAGSVTLARLALRRDRVTLLCWAVGLVAMFTGTAASYESLYPPGPARESLSTGLASNSAIVAVTGPAFDLSGSGGFVAWRLTASGVILGAVLSVLAVTRHTRANEEAGRSELVDAGGAGRLAELTSATGVVLGANLVVGGLLALALAGIGIGWAGSVLLGLSVTGAGCVFTAVTALSAQLVGSARGTSGIALACLGVSYGLRVVGDTGPTALSWVSPVGWAQRSRPFAGDEWWVLLLPAGLTLVLLVVAGWLARRRELGSSLLQQRAGPGHAGRGLRSPEGLAIRSMRGSLLGWGTGLLLYAVVVGLVTSSVRRLLGSSGAARAYLDRLGGGGALERGYVAAMAGVLALVTTGFALQTLNHLHSEELSGRGEYVLVRGVSRWRWAAGYLGVSLIGSLLLLTVAGLGAGVADSLHRGTASGLSWWLEACLANVPAVWLAAAIMALAIGLLPRMWELGWIVFAASALLVEVGPAIQAPGWVKGLSPFAHVPTVPSVPFTWWSTLTLLGLVLAGVVVGAIGLRRRDLL